MRRDRSIRLIRNLVIASVSCASVFASPIWAQEEKPQVAVGFFAIGSCAANTRNHPNWIPQMKEIGVTNLRAFGNGWGGIEPEPGKFVFDTFDKRYAYLISQGVFPGVTLEGNPKWNEKDKGKDLPVNNIEGWANYVSKIVEHGKGKITYYEVWNEPPNGTKGAPPSDYAKIVVAAYDAAKKADPNCKVGLAAKSVHVNYLDQVIAAGAKDHFDYITLHPYEVLGSVTTHPGAEQLYMRIVPTVRRMLEHRNPEKKDVPIIFTEIGFDSKKGADKQMQALVKAYVMGAAQGVTMIQWFEGMDGDSGPMGIMDGKGNKRPAYTALGTMIRLIGQQPKPLGWVQLNDKHYGFVFQGPTSVVMATWAGSAKPDEVSFGQQVKIVDPATGNASDADKIELTMSPVFIDGVPEAIVKQARANSSKPFPWNGDYSDAKSVSVTFGEKNVEKGLHTMSAETIAADVIAYGGNARSGTVPGGNVFNVDANFLNYDAVPLEITVVVRRNEKNEPAKIDCEYEAIGFYDKYKKLPAFDIPDNTQWHTHTWRIDDPQFVATWAFNFRLNKGSYAIQSVTVTKAAK